MMAKSLILCGPNSNSIPNKYLGFEYKGLVFCRNNGVINENNKHGQGTHSTKMSADKSAENIQNAAQHFGPICLPKPKSLGISKKALSGCL
jgi:hypothetical protein